MITIRKKRYFFGLTLLVLPTAAFCQQEIDTAGLIKEYNKVMAFTANSYVHYTTVTKLDASPVLQSQDTASLYGEFFKRNTEVYSNNVREEVYLQDSLMININNDRKTIWINKVDVTTKSRMNEAAVFGKDIQQIMKRNYRISKFIEDENNSTIVFETRKPQNSGDLNNTRISIRYNSKTYLPQYIDIDLMMKEVAGEEVLAALKEEGVDETKLLQEINGVQYLVRKQRMHIQFSTIDFGENLTPMPLYSSCIEYNKNTEEFSGKGRYSEYEITKLF